MNETQVLALMLPVFLPIATGWLTTKAKLLDVSSAEVLSKLFLYVCAPSLIIVDLSRERLSSLIEPRLILATLLLMLVLYVGLFLIEFELLGRKSDVCAFAAFAGTKFNAIVIGFPILFATVRHHAIVTMTINVVIGYFTILPLTLILSSVSGMGCATGPTLRKVLWKSTQKAVTHPLVMTTIIGLILAGVGVHIPESLDATLLSLGEAAIPIALLAVGMSLSAVRIRTNVAEIIGISAVRMILSPTLAIIFARLFKLPPVFAVALVVSFSLPTAKMVLPLAIEHETYVPQSSGIIAMTTASLIIVWPVVILLCERLWPGVITGGLG